MENQGPLILDISSDEETGFGDAGKGGGAEFGDKEDGDWLSKLLVEVDGNIDDGSDDVVFLSEVLPQKKSRSDFAKPKVAVDEDDDCVVLDGDPDSSVVVVNNKVDDSDDIEIVGEKGEVACRDFPHSRHLCATYLFASSPHEVHCSQCHCYVCDSLAPCSNWGTGLNSIDHCHASDKYEYWKTERKHVKNSDKPVKKIGKPLSNICTRIDSLFQSIQKNPNPLPQNQGFNPVTIHPCNLSSSAMSSNPMMNRVRSQPQPGNVAQRFNPRSLLVSVQPYPRNNNTVVPRVALRNRNHPFRSQDPLFPQRAGFKRNGVVGASVIRSITRRPPFQAPVTNGNYGSNQHLYGTQPVVSVIPQPELSSPHKLDDTHANYLPSQPQINSQPYSSCGNPDLVPVQAQMPSQPPANAISLPLPPYVYPQPSVGNIDSSAATEPYTAYVPDSHVPPESVSSWQADAENTFSDRWLSGSTISSSLSNVGTAFGHDSSQLQEHSNPTTSSLTCDQNNVQHQYHTQSGMGSSSTDFGFFCDSSVNHNNVQIHAEQSRYPSAEASQLQNMQHERPSVASVVVDNHPQQSAELANANVTYDSPIIYAEPSQIQNIQHDQPRIASLVVDNRSQQSVEIAAADADACTSTMSGADCQLPESKEPGSFDFDFLDSWMFENQSFSGTVEANTLPNWNVYSPEAAFADTGTLFDL